MLSTRAIRYLLSEQIRILETLGAGFYAYGNEKRFPYQAARSMRGGIDNGLDLQIAFYKRIPLGCGPIPCLCYLLHHSDSKILARNQRRFRQRLQNLAKKGGRASSFAQIKYSYRAWEILDFEKGA